MVSYGTRSVKIELVGTLEGHKGWVTQIATTRVNEEVILSSSRDKTIIVWKINPSGSKFGYAKKALRGHGHFVSDVVFSSDSQFALSSSWDHTLRLWDLNEGRTTRKFADHKKDVLSVSFSSDNRQIVSSSRDNTIKLWNTLGQCKYTISEDCNDWISCVRFSPDPQLPIIVSCGWDKLVKVWNLKNCRLKVSHHGHTGYLNTVAVSPDGSLCASGGRDGHAMLWDLTKNKFVHSLETIDTINALCFSPKRYWLCVAGGSSIKVYDLEQHTQIYDDLKPAATINDLNKQDDSEKVPDHDFKAECTCLAWSQSGLYLYAGYTDGKIRVWQVNE